MDTGKKSFWDLFKSKTPKTAEVKSPSTEFANYSGGSYRVLYATSFNGEKNFGEMGDIKRYILDYEALRLRSWQAYLESEIAQTVINKFVSWIVGGGLKLQSEPLEDFLKTEGITIDKNTFSQAIENRWILFADSKKSSYSGMESLNDLQEVVYKNAILGGDMVVILRYENSNWNVQLIDGTHVQSPVFGSEWMPRILENGNRLVSGIELNDKNEHVAYYIKKDWPNLDYERVLCKSSDGLVRAFMVYGSRYRIDTHRGMPLIATVLETLSKMERYKEATLGSAEERAKIVYQIVHKEYSTGESPLTNQLAKAYDIDAPLQKAIPVDDLGVELANTVAATTNKATYNMPQGSEMKALDSKSELHFKDFYTINIDIVCACLEIPPDVAMSKYNENYSASRAAIKDWEHTNRVKRLKFANQFLKPIYAAFFHAEALKNKINAPGYVKAFLQQNWFVIEAYLKARWIGDPVPHIDPVKEVEAERKKLGDSGLSIPLTTVEAATEALNGGDAMANIEQYAKELEKTKTLKIEAPIQTAPASKPAN